MAWPSLQLVFHRVFRNREHEAVTRKSKKTPRSWKVGSVKVFFVEGGCRALLRTNIH